MSIRGGTRESCRVHPSIRGCRWDKKALFASAENPEAPEMVGIWGEARLLLSNGPAPVNRCRAINTKLSPLAHQILRYLREHPQAEDTIEGIMVWWISERAIKLWLPEARKSIAALVSRGYLAKNTGPDGQILYRATKLPRPRKAGSRK